MLMISPCYGLGMDIQFNSFIFAPCQDYPLSTSKKSFFSMTLLNTFLKGSEQIPKSELRPSGTPPPHRAVSRHSPVGTPCVLHSYAALYYNSLVPAGP